MSSITGTAISGTGNISRNDDVRQTCWCYECDRSVFPVSSTPLICPNCHGDFLYPEAPLDPLPTLTLAADDDTFQIPADPDDDTFARYHHPASTPASNSFIESIATVKITNSFLAADILICAVCIDEFVVDVEAKQLPCKHLYHCDCILPWLSQHNSCPICRFRLPMDEPEQRSRAGLSRGSSVAVRFGNLMEDEDFFGIFARSQTLVFPVRSTAATVDSTQMAQAETSSAGPANTGETVSSWPAEEWSGTILSGGGGVGNSATRRDEDGDTVMSEIRSSFD